MNKRNQIDFSMIFLNAFQFFFLKMKKVGKFGLNYYRDMIQPLVLSILRRSFKNTNIKIFSSEEGISLPPTKGVMISHIQKLYINLLLLL